MGNSTEDDNDFYADIIDAPEFWSGLAIAGMILSVMITLSNAVLLFTIYKDPRRSFRTPPSFLIANLSAAEFLQGSCGCVSSGFTRCVSIPKGYHASR